MEEKEIKTETENDANEKINEQNAENVIDEIIDDNVSTNKQNDKKELLEKEVENMSHKDAKKLLKETLKEKDSFKKKVEALEKDLAVCKEETKKTKESWMRTAADFDNFKKRNSDTRMNAYREGKTDVITKILVVGDNLERALLMELDEKTRKGVELTLRQFKETLASMDVTEINPVGEKFDPHTQEAVMQAEKGENEESGTVKQVFLKGYKLGDKIIRFAQVVVVG